MASRKNRSPADVAGKVASISSYQPKEESIEGRPSRSKRGMVGPDISQVCFKIEKERHKALKLYAMQQDQEIGEVLDDLIREHLGL